jgi:PilZ domain
VQTNPNSGSGGFTGTSERRAHPRYRPQPFAYAKVDEHNGGIVMDASQGGLQVAAANSLAPENIVRLSLQLSTSAEPVEVQARVVWLSESKKTGGLEFLSLTEEARRQIYEWLASDAGRTRFSAPKVAPSRPTAAQSATETRVNPAQNETRRPPVSGPVPKGYEQMFPPEGQPIPPSPVREAAAPDAVSAEDHPASLNSVREAAAAGRGPIGDRAAGLSSFREPAPSSGDRIVERQADLGYSRGPWPPPQNEARYPARAIFSNSPFQTPPIEPSRWTKSGMGLLIVAVMVVCFAVGMIAGRVWMGKWPRGWNLQNLQELFGSTSAPAPPPPATIPASNPAENPDTNLGASGNSAAAPAPDVPASDAPAVSSPATPPEGSSADSEDEAAPIPNPVEDRTPATSEPLPPELGGRTIFVTAPAPGSPSTSVSLPQEPFTASASVAIGVRRSAVLPPQPGPVSAHYPERLEFGKVMAPAPDASLGPGVPRMGDQLVLLRVTIGEQGEIKSIVPLRGRDELIPTAERLVREWQHVPARLNGQPIESTEDVSLAFRTGP